MRKRANQPPEPTALSVTLGETRSVLKNVARPRSNHRGVRRRHDCLDRLWICLARWAGPFGATSRFFGGAETTGECIGAMVSQSLFRSHDASVEVYLMDRRCRLADRRLCCPPQPSKLTSHKSPTSRHSATRAIVRFADRLCPRVADLNRWAKTKANT